MKTSFTLSSVNVRAAIVPSFRPPPICDNFIANRNLKGCFSDSESLYDFVTLLLFQGLTNAVYINADTNNITLKGPLVSMINNGSIDTLYAWRTLTAERQSLYGMTLPFGSYSFGIVRRVDLRDCRMTILSGNARIQFRVCF
jgi:hypothetical protein